MHMCLQTVPPPPFWYNTLVLPPYPALVDSQRSCHSFSSPFGTSFHFVLSLTVVQIQRDILKKSSGPLLRTLLVGECQHTKLAKIVIKCGISCALSATVLCPLVCRCTLRRPPLVKWSAMQASVARTLLFLGCVCACAWSVVSFFLFFRTGSSAAYKYVKRVVLHPVGGHARLCVAWQFCLPSARGQVSLIGRSVKAPPHLAITIARPYKQAEKEHIP